MSASLDGVRLLTAYWLLSQAALRSRLRGVVGGDLRRSGHGHRRAADEHTRGFPGGDAPRPLLHLLDPATHSHTVQPASLPNIESRNS